MQALKVAKKLGKNVRNNSSWKLGNCICHKVARNCSCEHARKVGSNKLRKIARQVARKKVCKEVAAKYEEGIQK